MPAAVAGGSAVDDNTGTDNAAGTAGTSAASLIRLVVLRRVLLLVRLVVLRRGKLFVHGCVGKCHGGGVRLFSLRHEAATAPHKKGEEKKAPGAK